MTHKPCVWEVKLQGVFCKKTTFPNDPDKDFVLNKAVFSPAPFAWFVLTWRSPSIPRSIPGSIFFTEMVVLLMAEIRRSPVDMVVYPIIYRVSAPSQVVV